MSLEKRVADHFHPDGTLKTRITYLPGPGRHWIVENWHPNGVKISEIPVRNGTVEGKAKFWNAKGEPIGDYEIRDGTGIEKDWHSDGTLRAETPWREGKEHGRARTFFSSGELGSESYWIGGQKVSKMKYLAACLEDQSLPRYEDFSVAQRSTRKPKLVLAREEKSEDSAVSRLLAAPATREVLEWLRSGQPGTRILGELRSQDASVELAEAVYGLGATKVWAVEIDSADPEMEGTSKLIVALPKAKASRARVLKWCGEWAERNGYEAEADTGQAQVFVMLD